MALMHRAALVSVGLVLVAPLAWADDKVKTLTLPKPAEAKAVDEVWEAAYIKGPGDKYVKIGHVHMTSVPVERDGVKVIRTSKELRYVVARSGQESAIKADLSSDEDAAGKVKAIRGKIWLGADRVQILDCTVVKAEKGEKIVVSADGERKYQKEMRWDPAALGLAGELTLLRDKKAKSGDKFDYRTFTPQLGNFIRVRVVVGEKEKVTLPGGTVRELLKAVFTPDPIEIQGGGKVQLPGAAFWVDPVGYDVVKSEEELPGIATVTLVRTSKAAALAPNGEVPDLMRQQSVFLKAAIPDIHERASAVYKVTYSGEALPKDLVRTDARQAIRNVDGKAFELHITARRGPGKGAEEKAGDEYLKSNYYLTSADALVQAHAAKAVGTAKDPWEKARKIEGWVRQNMKVANFSEALAPADHVAKTLTGDCTEYAMLSAAMCKAQGVPARTAVGLVFVNGLLGRPAGLAFHMWTEVFVDGQWLGLDATLGQGSIGPGHLKITDSSWAGELGFNPLLPVTGFLMAKPAVEVVGK
jgi:hypothetical protein